MIETRQHYFSQDTRELFDPKETEVLYKRPAYSQKETVVPAKRKVVQYELAFDQQKATELAALKETAQYEEEEEKFEGFINMQLLTMLGERFNLGLSEYSYRVHDNKLYGEHSDEPFEDTLERGRAYREVHGNPIDHPREKAEFDGFKKIQAILADEETPVGTIMLSVSPPGEDGSIYKHNFYDGFQKMADGAIRVIRFSSALTPEETIEKLLQIDPTLDVPEELSDVSLLSSPFVLSLNLDLEQLHEYLHREHEVMSKEDFAKVKELSTVLITSYIATLKKDPQNKQKLSTHLNALLNGADEVADLLKNKTFDARFGATREWQYTEQDIVRLGVVPVRKVDTGCGFSGGFGLGEGMGMISAVGPFSVSEFSSGGQDQYGSLEFKCPSVSCGKTNKRERGKLIEKCQHCFVDVRC